MKNRTYRDIIIKNLKPGIVRGDQNVFKKCKVFTDPSGKSAAAEGFRNLFPAAPNLRFRGMR